MMFSKFVCFPTIPEFCLFCHSLKSLLSALPFSVELKSRKRDDYEPPGVPQPYGWVVTFIKGSPY